MKQKFYFIQRIKINRAISQQIAFLIWRGDSLHSTNSQNTFLNKL